MIKNNKGVTLVELLIVIVVMGIIAAFAIPAVGTIIENTQRDAILADAIQVENAANLYCASNSCDTDEELVWDDLSPYVQGISASGQYDFAVTGHSNDLTVAEKTPNGWEVYLEADGDNSDWEWSAGAIPKNSTRTQVVVDDN